MQVVSQVQVGGEARERASVSENHLAGPRRVFRFPRAR